LYLDRGTPGFDDAALRQGDILAGVPYPQLEHAKTFVLGEIAQEYDYTALPAILPKTHVHRGEDGWVTIQVPAKFCFCAVLSNCCDLEPHGGKIRAHAVTLARVRTISGDIRGSVERFDSLRANKDPRDPADPGYIDYFYLEQHALLQNLDWSVAFSQVVTLPTLDIALLLRKKILQLDDRTRMKFKIKLAFTLGRSNDDEINAGLENPWANPPAAPIAPPAPVPPPAEAQAPVAPDAPIAPQE
jgi:hypothetical protein